MQGIKNIIFDLGGVILDLDINRTNQAYRDMGISNIDDLFRNGFAESFFKDYEKGNLTAEQFVEKVQNLARPGITQNEIVTAWNALLIEYPPERILWLKSLKEKYRLFLFSNTNGIHYDFFQDMYKKAFANGNFDDLFEKAYYSHIAGVRKPDAASYELVIRENNLNKTETVFIDDALVNVEAARNVGIHAVQIVPGMTILDLRSEFQD